MRALSIDTEVSNDPWGAADNATQRYGVDGSAIEPSFEGLPVENEALSAADDDAPGLILQQETAPVTPADARSPSLHVHRSDGAMDVDDAGDVWSGDTLRFATGSMSNS